MRPCDHPPIPAELEPLHLAILAAVPWWRLIVFGGGAVVVAALVAVVCWEFPAEWRAERERRREEALRRMRREAIERAIADYHERRARRPRRISRERER